MPTELTTLSRTQLEDLLGRINDRMVALDWEVEKPRAERDKIRRGLASMHRKVTSQLALCAA